MKMSMYKKRPDFQKATPEVIVVGVEQFADYWIEHIQSGRCKLYTGAERSARLSIYKRVSRACSLPGINLKRWFIGQLKSEKAFCHRAADSYGCTSVEYYTCLDKLAALRNSFLCFIGYEERLNNR